MLRRTIASIAALALLTTACGGSQDSNTAQNSGAVAPASAAPQSRDACALITAEEAEKILGSPVTVTSRSVSGQRSVCDYVTKAFESFTLEATWQGAEEEIKTARTAATAATSLAGKQDQVVNDVMGLQKVENLGDEAYFSRRTMSYVRKGDVLLTFQNAGLNDPAAREHWEALARAAVARL